MCPLLRSSHLYRGSFTTTDFINRVPEIHNYKKIHSAFVIIMDTLYNVTKQYKQ